MVWLIIDDLDQWLRERRQWVIALVLASAAIVRILYFMQLAPTPLVSMHELPSRDMNYFDTWAKQIAHGDILSRHIESPLHSWHYEVAQRFAEQFPDRLDELGVSTELDRDELARKLWNRWCPPGRFYQDPFYPYFIGAVYAVCAESPQAVFVLQLALGCVSCWLIYAIAVHAFGETCGVVAAIVAVFCPQMPFYEMVLHRTSLIVFVGLLLTWQLQRADSGRRWFWAGVISGISLLLQIQFIAMAVAAIVAIFASDRSNWRRACTWTSLLILGIVIGLMPLVTRNLLVGVPPFSPPTGGYLTFIGANTPDAPSLGFSMSPMYAGDLIDRSHGSLVRSALLTYDLHSNAGAFFRHVVDRFTSTWNWYEVPNNENLYLFQIYAPILRWLPMSFTWIASLGIVGLALGMRYLRTTWPLYAIFALYLIVQLVFYAIARYRAPMTIALIPFGALTIVELIARLRAAHWKSSACIGASVLLFAAVISRPQPQQLPTIYLQDVMPLYEFVVVPSVNIALDRSDNGDAIEIFERFIRAVPVQVLRLEAGLPPEHPSDLELAQFYRDRFQDGERLAALAGKPDRGSEFAARAQHLDAVMHRFSDRAE